MASPYSVLASVESSNLGAREKSSIRRWVENVASGEGMGMVGDMGHAAMHAVRGSGEGLVVGGLLGVAHAELKTGLDVKKMPVDAGMGVLGMLASIATADGDGVNVDARNVGITCLGVFSFRKTYDLLAEKRIAAGKGPGGTFGPAQTAKVAGELGDDDLDDEADGGYVPDDGVDEGYLTSEEEIASADMGADPILAIARTL